MLHASVPPLIIGNWKMYKTIAETRAYVRQFVPLIRPGASQAWLAVPFTALSAAVQEAEGSPVRIGAQNVSEAEEGAFTGEISCRMLKEAGAAFVIVGHSERRQLFGENDLVVNRKALRVLHAGMCPVVCVGETAQQRHRGQAKEIVTAQLCASLAGISADDMKRIKVAYEPVWAIGTDQTATPAQAQEMHRLCRDVLARDWGQAAAESVAILYGGSVKPANAAALLAQPDINGLLVGGSSLDAEIFSQIVNDQHNNAS